MSDSPRSRRRPVVLLSFVLVGVIGVAAALLALADTEDDPINVLLQNWPLVALAGLIYALGMCVYAVSWALLFDKADNRGLIGLSFLISQPVKYLPGGVAQPISQVALTAQVSESRAGAVVAFPVHVLINVIVGLTLAAPLLLVMEQTGGNQLRAAEVLGLNRNTLRKKLARLGLTERDERPRRARMIPRRGAVH